MFPHLIIEDKMDLIGKALLFAFVLFLALKYGDKD